MKHNEVLRNWSTELKMLVLFYVLTKMPCISADRSSTLLFDSQCIMLIVSQYYISDWRDCFLKIDRMFIFIATTKQSSFYVRFNINFVESETKRWSETFDIKQIAELDVEYFQIRWTFIFVSWDGDSPYKHLPSKCVQDLYTLGNITCRNDATTQERRYPGIASIPILIRAGLISWAMK